METALMSLAFFSGLENKDLKRIMSLAARMDFKKGATIFTRYRTTDWDCPGGYIAHIKPVSDKGFD